jgi:hypothetical protein
MNTSVYTWASVSSAQSLLVRVIRAIRGFNGLVRDEVRLPSGKTGSAREDAKARRSQNRVPDSAVPSWSGRRSGDPTPEAASSGAAHSRNAAMSGAFEEWDQRLETSAARCGPRDRPRWIAIHCPCSTALLSLPHCSLRIGWPCSLVPDYRLILVVSAPMLLAPVHDCLAGQYPALARPVVRATDAGGLAAHSPSSGPVHGLRG